MTSMVVLTPSYAPDFELCADLHASVMKFTPDSVHHHLVVPRQDLPLFQDLAGPRTHLHVESDFLPKTFVPLPKVNFSVNLRHPYPPVRGWIRQQVLKLAAAAEMRTQVVLMVDSDISFVRPFSAETFVRSGRVRFFRRPAAVHEGMTRHLLWHRAARRMLGVPPAMPPHHDYVSSMLAWDPDIVRSMLLRIQDQTRRPWQTAVASELQISEWTLYGVFVDEVLGAPATDFDTDESLCHDYWGDTPLTAESAADFTDGIGPSDVAVMISAKSHTPLDVRRAAWAAAGS